MSLKRDHIPYEVGEDIAPCNWTKERVERFGEKVATDLSFEPGEKLGTLVTKLRGRIEFQTLDEWGIGAGSIYVHGMCDFDICLPVYTSSVRDQFTIAHELGHYFLHSNQGQSPIIAFRNGSTRIEWEANWFAAGLLMPKEPFEKACKKWADIKQVANHFNVSHSAASIRREAICG